MLFDQPFAGNGIVVPHLRRAMSVIIMIETIFFLAIFAEIFVTISWVPDLATTNLAYFIYIKAQLEFDVGYASAGGVIAIILCWNEAFWSLNLTTKDAAPLTSFIASFSAPEGLFWARLFAALTMAIAPILVLGWLSQKQLVRGLTFGAVK